MSKWLTACAAVLTLSLVASADYVSDRKAAVDLAKAGKNEEAMAAFIKMSGGDATAIQKADALEQAVLCAINLKKYDQALDLAKQIPVDGVSKMSRMRILEAQREWQAIVDQFKDEDISKWPAGLIGDGYWSRGRAAMVVKNFALSEPDLAKAADNLADGNAKALAYIDLGDNYQLMKNDDKALESYRKVKGNGNEYKECQAVAYAANVLLRQEKLDDAVKELNTLDIAKIGPSYWRDNWLVTYGNVLAKQGKKTEAADKYNAALKNPSIHPAIKAACEAGIKALQDKAN